MSERIKKFDEKLDKVIIEQIEIKHHLARNTDSLVEHVKRTQLLEERVKPIEDHVIFLRNLAKLLALVSAIVGIAQFFS